jgi:hypothetical protein
VRLEWAVNCEEIEESAHGYDLRGVGKNGYLIQQDELPLDVQLNLLVCFRAEPGDATEERVYQWWAQVIGPSGAQDAAPFGVQTRVDTSPQLIDPERYYLPIPIALTATLEGPYRVLLGRADAVSPEYEVVLRVNVLPSL